VAKVKFEAGAEWDMLTAPEVKGMLDDFIIKLGAGVKFRRIVGQLVMQTGVVQTSGYGPDPGFLWDVRYLKSDLSTATTPGSTSWFINDASSPVNLIANSGNAALQPLFFNKQILIHPGELLVPTAVGVTQGPAVALSIAIGVIEVPLFHEGQLLL
jgi:hypothetical protein